MPDKNDGGYYAIKGFLYQFDKTLIEIINNPDIQIGIEQRQDIDYQDYVIQVKHKETQEYADSKIRKAVLQLIEIFKADQAQKYCLYCYFNDREPFKWILTPDDLNRILSKQAENYTPYLKGKFVEAFYIQFSEDYESQFINVINLIKSGFNLTDKDLAYIYHSLLRSKLLELSIKEKAERKVSKHDLEVFLDDAEKNVFYIAYSKYLDKSKYERLIKKEFFTFKSANIENFERLFIIQCNKVTKKVILNKIVISLFNKYYKPGKSPQPYLCLTGLEDQDLVGLKQDLLDQGIEFDDGTYFNGDRFRLDRIIEKNLEINATKIKIVNVEYLNRVISRVKFHEIFQFYLTSPMFIDAQKSHTKIQIMGTNQVLRMVN